MDFFSDRSWYEWLNTWHWLLLTTLPVTFWFYEKSGGFPYRALAILLLLADILGMSLEHVLHSPQFYWHVDDLDGVDECFLVAWFASLSLLLRYTPRWVLLMMWFPVFLAVNMVVYADLSVYETLTAAALGCMIGIGLYMARHAMQRFTYGVEQLFMHHGSWMYPFALLVLFDINQDLSLFTASFHFMFGYGSAL